MTTTTQYRTENDLLGEVAVPVQAAYGAQTRRAIENFPLQGEKRFSDYPELLLAMLRVKKACVLANLRAGNMDGALGEQLLATLDRLIATPPLEEFPVHSFHGGGGISFNMNVNEVVANLANRDGFEASFGSYAPVHPNDHVNLNQSTNDVFASACHIAIIAKGQELGQELDLLAEALTAKGTELAHIPRLSRTCLQDAVEISFADFFSGYAAFVKRGRGNIERTVRELYAVNMGGTMVGRLIDADSGYLEEIIQALREVLDCREYTRTENLFDASQNLDDMVQVAGQLTVLARGLIKIAKDFRLISSGPMAGFGEVVLPAVQPGSSAMPGKVNPSVPEFLIQCCFQAVGRCAAAEMALDHGELDLNVWEAPVVINILDSIACLENGIKIFREKCVDGLEAVSARNLANINTLIPLMTRLKLEKGYSYATRVFKESGGDIEMIRKHAG